MRSATWLSALLLLTAAATAQPAPPPADFSAEDPLAALNRLFREAYRDERARMKGELSPVIVFAGDELTLVRDGKSEVARVLPPSFHQLKAIAHLPFALYLRLKRVADLPAGLTDLGFLADFRPTIARARQALSGLGLNARQLERQEEIFSATEALLAEVESRHTVGGAELRAFAARLGRAMLTNTHEAACLEIQGLHAQMMVWKKRMSCAEWGRLRAVNRASHQSRYSSAATQYFAWLLGGIAPPWAFPGESLRVVYAETLRPGDEARDLLATVVVDADASQAFFGDPLLLSADILSHGAANCIDTLPAEDRLCADHSGG